MAAGGVAESRRVFHLPASSISLTVREGNIVETSAEVVATGEDNGLGGHGAVSQLLLKSCPQTYKRAREELKKNVKKFEFGKVYPCPFPSVPSGGRKPGVSFSVVLHAIVPSPRAVAKEKDWMDQMKVLYYNLFKAANNQGRSSVAVPLLGSGQAGASLDVAIDVMAHALTTFHMKQEVRQSLRDIILYVRKDAFAKMVTKLETKLNPMLSQPNGVVPSLTAVSGTRPCGTGQGGGDGKTRPSSSSTRGRNAGSARVGGRRDQNSSGKKPTAAKDGASNGPTTARPQDTKDDDSVSSMSNMALILKGLTLDSYQSREEAMDCRDDTYSDVDDDDDGEANDEGKEEEEEDKCAICLDEIQDPKKLDKCGHTFCRECIEGSFKHHKPVCPSCNTVYGMITGNQPRGTMTMSRHSQGLPGYENCGQIIIDYDFPSGIQGPEHPNPGQSYHGTGRRAFLPDCAEGRKVYRLLRVAFENRLTFTIGRSVTTGHDNVVTWNDIHHKTRPFGGATGFGYPDPQYLSRVQEELAVKGVTEECLQGRTFDL